MAAGPSSQFHWRGSNCESNPSTSSEYASSTSAATSTPASSIIIPSPAASGPSPLPTLLEQGMETTEEDSTIKVEPEVDAEDKIEPDPPPTDSSSTRFASGSYKCNFQGCNTAPFQTQYLLNSHMNVHSNTRSHFCPVDGCPRGPGGQWFKRKNEMIRHAPLRQVGSSIG